VTPRVRVYVWTARPDAGGVDQKGREDSVTDLLASLSTSRYRRTFATVSTREESEIQVEVTARQSVNTSGRYQPVDPLGKKSLAPGTELTLFATLRFGDTRLDLSCGAGADNVLWRRTAQACSEKLLKWTLANLDRIRPPK
jgi:hypothetical protein